MPDISLRMGNAITHKDLARVKDTLPHLNPGDHLTITMEAADAHQADMLLEILKDHGLDFQSRGDSDGRTYFIIACRPEGT
ncbi:hypothetical protein [Neomoorella thermoacetica]|uniref:hypothetical protein n=1 Tax=Neomoorella thermoacetica TaxID=1525 RepID=UPI0008FB3CA0|nr:hypothetical protein [Moorella thermoacetica]OIQ53874.1 hypothetical protein MORE_18530 [Moorella thermoacetica]